MENLATFDFVQTDTATNLRGEPTDLAQGSRNLLPLGRRQYKPFRGLLPKNPLTGSRQMFLLKNGFGGLNDVVISLVNKEGSGSLFSYIADSLWYCGQGQVSVNGTPLGINASNLLRVVLKWGGVYNATESGPYLVGVAEPSTPTVGLSDTYPGDAPQMSGNYTLQYARLSKLGGRSRAGAATGIINIPSGKALAVTVPLPTTNTAKHIFFITQRQSGGLGKPLRLSRANYWTQREFTEEDVQRRTTVGVTNGSTAVTGTGFTAADVGKRFNPFSAGYSVPSGTTIVQYISPTSIVLSGAVTGTTGNISADIIAYANGIDRTIVLNWKETDLIAEEPWIYDFPPPPCSHAFALGARVGIISSADSATEASSDNRGSVLIPSLRNQPESFDLRYPVYLPEQVVDVLSRPQSDFVVLGCANGIYSVQEIASDLTPFYVEERLRGEGIKHAKNWAWSKNALYIFSAKGKICRLVGNGQIDTAFADSIAYLIRDYEQADTVLAFDPINDSLVILHKNIAHTFDEQTGRWSTELYLNDIHPGDAISAIGAESKLYVTLKDGSDFDLFEFDAGTATDTVTLSPYVAPSGNYQKVIQAVNAQFVADKPSKTVWLAVHANNLKTHCKKASVTGNTLTCAEGGFTAEMRGFYVLIRGAGVAGEYYYGQIDSVTNETTVVLVGAVSVNVTDVFVLIGRNIYPSKINREGTHQLESPALFLNQLQSFAVSMLIETDGQEAQALRINVAGHTTGEQWYLPSATFGIQQGVTSNVYQQLLERNGSLELAGFDFVTLFNDELLADQLPQLYFSEFAVTFDAELVAGTTPEVFESDLVDIFEGALT